MPETLILQGSTEHQLWLQYHALFLNGEKGISPEYAATLADVALREYRKRTPSIQVGPKP